jgi:soluble lytic murein transglycosylase-like protein
MSLWKQIACALLLAPTLWAADLAVLDNGYTIRHERREQRGDITRLWLTSDPNSFIDVPNEQIDHFEPDTTPAPPALPAKNFAATRPNVAPAPSVNEVIQSASHQYKLDPDFLTSVISAESGFKSNAVSRKGAKGLMQLMPQTASNLGVTDPFDPAKNVDGGTRYLRELLERYNYDPIKALAAYNAGPHRVEQFRGVPPYHETRAYVARIIHDFNRKKIAAEKEQQVKAPSAKTSQTKTSVINTSPAKAPNATQTPPAKRTTRAASTSAVPPPQGTQ